LLEHGMVDAVVHRHKLRETLIRMVTLLMDPLVVESAAAD
jgi:acetyl-CoA carboxylase carboxyl transferase subunit beta